MAYGIIFVDDNDTTFDDTSWTLQFLEDFTLTGEQSNTSHTVNLELPPDYDIVVIPEITYVPTDTRLPFWQNHATWKDLSLTSVKDTTGPTYGVTFTISYEYVTLGKQLNNSCQTINGTVTALATFKSQIKTTFRLMGTSVYT